jgi:hypothetical protein
MLASIESYTNIIFCLSHLFKIRTVYSLKSHFSLTCLLSVMLTLACFNAMFDYNTNDVKLKCYY